MTEGLDPDLGFWSGAPELLELAGTIGARLAESGLDDDVRRGVQELASRIPETAEPLSDVDPYLGSAMLTAVVHAQVALAESAVPELRVALERARQALRDLLDERPIWHADPKSSVEWLRALGISAGDLADLVGASDSTVRRWASRDDPSQPSADHAERLAAVAKIVGHLRHAMTAPGVVRWLSNPHPELDDRRPIDDLKDPASYRRLIHLASGARSFIAT